MRHLRRRMTEDMKVRGYAPKTIAAYIRCRSRIRHDWIAAKLALLSTTATSCGAGLLTHRHIGGMQAARRSEAAYPFPCKPRHATHTRH